MLTTTAGACCSCANNCKYCNSSDMCVNYPNGSDCGDCKSGYSGECTYTCSSLACQTCINDWCTPCNGDTNKGCCDGTCYDPFTEKCCNPPGDNNGYKCDSDQTCCDGDCCEPDECCHNGTCVDKCDPAGETCEHDTPVIEAGCQSIAPDDLRCFPDQIDKVCMWNLQYHYETSATCAFCASGCRTRDAFCSSYKAETCRNAWFIGCVCDYDGPENQRPQANSGDHYICN